MFSLSLGIEHEGVCFSTALIYAWALKGFRQTIGNDEFDSKHEAYSRYIAAAVFSTLDEPTLRGTLVEEYVQEVCVGTLKLKKSSDGILHHITPQKLLEKMNGLAFELPNVSGDIPSAKAPLFWSAPGRGIYQQAALVGSDLITKIIPLDRECLKVHKTSLLTPAIKIMGSQDHLLIENLSDIFSRDNELSEIWSRLMETLAKGVYEALAYIESRASVDLKPKEFWLHGISSIPEEEKSFVIKLNANTVPILPDNGCRVFLCERTFVLKKSETDGQHVSLELESFPD